MQLLILYSENCLSRGKRDRLSMQSSAAATLLDLVQGVSSGFRTLATMRDHQEPSWVLGERVRSQRYWTKRKGVHGGKDECHVLCFCVWRLG